MLPEVAAQVQAFYVGAGLPPSAVRFEAGLAAGHGFAVLDGPVACAVTGPPFVNDCDLDQAGELLAFLIGPMQPPAAAAPAPVAFDQRPYRPSPGPRGMAETGYVYVPAACAAGEACRAHVVFHGCKQSAEQVGDAVTAGAGFNRWAETNRIVVLYPQAAATWSNPNGCWDWWGYTGAAYATRKGAQPAAVRRMLLALAGCSRRRARALPAP